MLNSPANPTGGVIPLEDLKHIAAKAQEFDAWVMSDEIYGHLAYDGNQVPSIASLPGMMERTIIVDGFSKTYAMTGWRLGYTIMPESLAGRVELLLTHSVGCTATFTQFAGMAALTGPQEQVDAMVAEYQRRRDHIVAGLNAIPGVTCLVPQGAFYVFPNVKSFGLPSSEIARRLLDEAGVAALSGTDFGQYGEGYLRLCYATSVKTIDRALEHMREFFRYVGCLETFGPDAQGPGRFFILMSALRYQTHELVLAQLAAGRNQDEILIGLFRERSRLDQVLEKFARSKQLLVVHAPAFAEFGHFLRPGAVGIQVFLAVRNQRHAFVIMVQAVDHPIGLTAPYFCTYPGIPVAGCCPIPTNPWSGNTCRIRI